MTRAPKSGLMLLAAILLLAHAGAAAYSGTASKGILVDVEPTAWTELEGHEAPRPSEDTPALPPHPAADHESPAEIVFFDASCHGAATTARYVVEHVQRSEMHEDGHRVERLLHDMQLEVKTTFHVHACLTNGIRFKLLCEPVRCTLKSHNSTTNRCSGWNATADALRTLEGFFTHSRDGSVDSEDLEVVSVPTAHTNITAEGRAEAEKLVTSIMRAFHVNVTQVQQPFATHVMPSEDGSRFDRHVTYSRVRKHTDYSSCACGCDTEPDAEPDVEEPGHHFAYHVDHKQHSPVNGTTEAQVRRGEIHHAVVHPRRGVVQLNSLDVVELPGGHGAPGIILETRRWFGASPPERKLVYADAIRYKAPASRPGERSNNRRAKPVNTEAAARAEKASSSADAAENEGKCASVLVDSDDADATSFLSVSSSGTSDLPVGVVTFWFDRAWDLRDPWDGEASDPYVWLFINSGDNGGWEQQQRTITCGDAGTSPACWDNTLAHELLIYDMSAPIHLRVYDDDYGTDDELNYHTFYASSAPRHGGPSIDNMDWYDLNGDAEIHLSWKFEPTTQESRSDVSTTVISHGSSYCGFTFEKTTKPMGDTTPVTHEASASLKIHLFNTDYDIVDASGTYGWQQRQDPESGERYWWPEADFDIHIADEDVGDYDVATWLEEHTDGSMREIVGPECSLTQLDAPQFKFPLYNEVSRTLYKTTHRFVAMGFLPFNLHVDLTGETAHHGQLTRCSRSTSYGAPLNHEMGGLIDGHTLTASGSVVVGGSVANIGLELDLDLFHTDHTKNVDVNKQYLAVCGDEESAITALGGSLSITGELDVGFWDINKKWEVFSWKGIKLYSQRTCRGCADASNLSSVFRYNDKYCIAEDEWEHEV